MGRLSEMFKKRMLTLAYKIIETYGEYNPEDERKISPGDVVWCVMPLNKEALMKIEPGHRIRPYVVLEADSTQITGYACSSKFNIYVSRNQQYFIDGKKYGLNHSNYINFSSEIVLPITSVERYFFTLSDEDFNSLKEKANQADKSWQATEIGVGSIVEKNQRLYYIYWYKQPYFKAYPLVQNKSQIKWSVIKSISCKQQVYYINYALNVDIHQDTVLKKIMQLSKKDIRVLEEGQNGAVKKISHKSVPAPMNKDEIHFDYMIGQVLYDPAEDRNFLYLLHKSSHAIGCYLDNINGSKYQIKKKKTEFMKLDKLLNKDEFFAALDNIGNYEMNKQYIDTVRKHAEKEYIMC